MVRGGCVLGICIAGILNAQEQLQAIASTGYYIVYSIYVENPLQKTSLQQLDAEDYAEALTQIRVRAQTYLKYYIYGAPFEYRPHSTKYAVPETFDAMDPAAPLLHENELIDASVDIGAISFVYRYTLGQDEQFYRTLWEEGIHETYNARGTGETPEDAFLDALRIAVREPLRKREWNKPRKITGRIVLNRMPREYFSEGRFVCEVQTLLTHVSVEPYDALFLQ